MFYNVNAGYFFVFIGTDIGEGADDLKEDERTDDSECISYDDGDELSDERISAAVEEAVCTGGVYVSRAPQAGCDSAPGAADAVNAESVEGIIIAEFLFYNSDCKVAYSAADETDDDSGHRSYEACCRSDCYKAGNTAGCCTEDGRFAVMEPFNYYPGNSCHSGSSLSRYESVGSQSVGAKCGAGVEAEPAEPQESCTEDYHRKVVRNHGNFAVAASLAEQDADGEAGYTGEDVNYEAAGEVKSTELCEEAAAPYPVCHGVVDEDSPEENEHAECAEFHAFCKCTGDERRSDYGEHALECNECQFRDGAVAHDLHADTGQAELVEAADEAADIIAESHRIAEDDPFYRYHCHDEETVHYRAEHVFASYHAAVEEAEARSHDEYECGTDEYPCGIARIKSRSFVSCKGY